MYCESGIRHGYVAIMSVDTAKRPEKKQIKTNKNKKNNLGKFGKKVIALTAAGPP